MTHDDPRRESGGEKLLVETGAARYFPRFAAASTVMLATERVFVPWTTSAPQVRAGTALTKDQFDADALIDASLPLLDMTLSEESRAVVKMHLETAEALSRPVREFSLDDHSEPAPVYSA